jgi:hypothetical protein
MPLFKNMSRPTFLLSSILGLALLLTSTSCGSSSSGKPDAASSGSGDIPELSDDVIRERINETWVRDVAPAENANSEPITWSFDENEPKEIAIVEKRIESTRATIVLDIKTSSAPRARNQRYLAGQIRTEWELKTGWVLRRWEIVETENISMKYKDLPKTPREQNSNSVDPNRPGA